MSRDDPLPTQDKFARPPVVRPDFGGAFPEHLVEHPSSPPAGLVATDVHSQSDPLDSLFMGDVSVVGHCLRGAEDAASGHSHGIPFDVANFFP